MATAGFKRHLNEWWHFSYGDQIWAWLMTQEGERTVAKYGRAR
jgi:D-alanyl-D-alanine dipeptidase